MTLMLMSPAILTLLALPTLSVAYTWKFETTPQQCANLTISVSGSGGKPPYRVLILPFGPTPLAHNIEARKIVDHPFPGDSTSVSFKLNFPGSSQFVAVLHPLGGVWVSGIIIELRWEEDCIRVSDARGFGSGGTSVAAEVTSSSDDSCFDSTKNVSPEFVFSIEPPNQIVQCVPTRIWWDKTTVQGTPNFLGLIPGGQSFAIPESEITDVPSQGTGFSWTPSLRGGTTLIIVGGDSRGNGTAGSTLNTVSNGPNNIGNCLSDSSPSSTPGSPAGGSYPTSPSGGGVDRGDGANVGAIVGGVIGGVAGAIAIVLLLLFFRRRARVHNKQKERPVDLLNADEGDEYPPGGARLSRNELPEYYQPEPFTVPDPTTASTYDGDTGDAFSEGRPLSGYTTTTRSGTPDLLSSYGGAGSTTTGGGRKGGLRQMRPVNVIQHDDAGPSDPPNSTTGEVETVELPPAYTNIRR
ncbi:hypothetical protein D9615_005943 [Tricholomella constricta]|uniref:Uncharacterized protein n=1 Tax=Tricholomella constricta TaxID=117010 RepID=A0A8H5H9C5_9AGAR|nr:hypothetical protein D9615_005943 [Tricholomella constricta]